MKRIITLFVMAFVMTFSFTPANAAEPVQAKQVALAKRTCPDGHCSNIVHISPDDGYDACFYVYGHKYLSNGGWTDAYGFICEGQGAYGNGFADVNQIWTNDNAEYRCTNYVGGWETQWDGNYRWHNVDPFGIGKDAHCVYSVD